MSNTTYKVVRDIREEKFSLIKELPSSTLVWYDYILYKNDVMVGRELFNTTKEPQMVSRCDWYMNFINAIDMNNPAKTLLHIKPLVTKLREANYSSDMYRKYNSDGTLTEGLEGGDRWITLRGLLEEVMEELGESVRNKET